jgi:F-type H+-transporting ATPase subunit b
MKVFIILALTIETALAAGGYEQGPISKLIFPAMNFSLVMGLVIFLLRKPLKEFFNKNAEDITSLYYHAEEKEKEAAIKLNMYKEKMGNLEGEKKKILDSSETELRTFKAKTTNETAEQIKKLEEDAKVKMDYELNMLKRKLNESLLDEVIQRTKNSVRQDEDLRGTITSKLTQGVQ